VLRIRLSHGNNLDVIEHRGTVAGSTDRDPGAPRRGVGLGGQPLVSDGDPLVWPGGAWHGAAWAGGLVSFLFTHGCSIRDR
jgi:hypothetical protein